MSTQTTFIDAQGVGYTFANGSRVLANVSFTLSPGAFVALVGPSGTGKSTLLRLLAGLLKPTQGKILLAGESPQNSPHPIGIMFQKDNLFPWRTVYDNVRLPLELTNKANGDVNGRIQAMLQLVGLEGYENNYPSQISGGMAQRVALARALIHHPDLLLLDEPFGALDALTRDKMGAELLRIWDAMPVTVFLVTHSIPEAVFLADDVLVMNGRPATITHHIPIHMPRPRQLSIEQTIEFQEKVTLIRTALQR